MSSARKDYKLYLLDIISSCQKILRYTKNKDYDTFAASPMMIDAVVRNLEIIGEAIGNIPSGIKEDIKEVPWKDIVGLRNKVIHAYFDVNLSIIWETIKKDIPNFHKQIQKALKDVGSKQLKLKTK